MASREPTERYGLKLHVGKNSGRVHEYEWRAHPAQSEILRDEHRFQIVAAGRRFGKTELAAIRALQWSRTSSKRRPVWWVAPTYDLCEPGLSAIESLWPEDWIDKLTTAPGNMRVTLEWGGVLEFKSAEKEKTTRGRGVRGLVAEECGEIRETVWTNGLRPTMADAQAPGLFIGTPKGRTWFWRLAQRGLDPKNWPDHRTFLYSTSANPVIAPSEVEAMRKEMPDRAFRQEILAEFIDESGGVFPNPRACVKGILEAPKAGEKYVAGWDPAKHQDYSVLTIDRVRDRHTVYWDRFQKVPFPEQKKRVVDACLRYKADLLMDSTHGSVGDPLFEDVARVMSTHGLHAYPYNFTHASKANLVNNLAAYVGSMETSWPDLPVLTNEVEIYEYKEGGRSGAPEGWHDDCVISKALAVWFAHRIGLTSRSTEEPLDLSRFY